MTSDEWPLWRDLRLAALADSPEAFGSRLADWVDADVERWQDRLREVPYNVVVYADDEPVGQASGTALAADRRIELTSMWVAPRARATEAASSLVDAVAGFGADLGASAIRLSVRRANARAIAFYERVGFVVVDEPADEPSELTMVRPSSGPNE